MSYTNPQYVELIEDVVEEVQEEVVEEPPKPKRGRPKGSTNKPKVQVVSREEEPIEWIPEAASEPPPPPKPKRQPRARAKSPPPAPEPTQIDIAAFMLRALRQQQQ